MNDVGAWMTATLERGADEPTMPSSRPCAHVDMAGESTVEAINGAAWCASCGVLIHHEGETS